MSAWRRWTATPPCATAFVNALGEVVLDGDILAESIDCEALRTMRYCVAEYLKRIEEREAEEEGDE